MSQDDCRACQPTQEINPLLFVFFCPHCVLSGLFALAATGVVTLPYLFGVRPEMWLAPGIILGTFFAWLAWGAWSRRSVAGDTPGACGGTDAEAPVS